MFIHDALKELIMCGETEILAPNLGIVINKLSRTKDGVAGFEKQFQVGLYSFCRNNFAFSPHNYYQVYGIAYRHWKN